MKKRRVREAGAILRGRKVASCRIAIGSAGVRAIREHNRTSLAHCGVEYALPAPQVAGVRDYHCEPRGQAKSQLKTGID